MDLTMNETMNETMAGIIYRAIAGTLGETNK